MTSFFCVCLVVEGVWFVFIASGAGVVRFFGFSGVEGFYVLRLLVYSVLFISFRVIERVSDDAFFS